MMNGAKPISEVQRAPGLVKVDDLTVIVETEVKRLNLDIRMVNAAMAIFQQECYKVTKGGELYYRNTLDQKYKGIGQFSSYSWNLILSAYPEMLEGKGYEFVGDPRASVLATLAYIVDSRKVHKARYGEDILNDNKLIYLYHQQGAPGAKSYLETGKLSAPVQSAASVALFKQIDRSNYV